MLLASSERRELAAYPSCHAVHLPAEEAERLFVKVQIRNTGCLRDTTSALSLG